MFCDRMDVEKPQRVTLQFFGIVRLFSKFFFSLARQGLALAGLSAPLGPFFGFSIFEYCKLALGNLFAIFEPSIWRRLGPIRGLFLFMIEKWVTVLQVMRKTLDYIAVFVPFLSDVFAYNSLKNPATTRVFIQ